MEFNENHRVTADSLWVEGLYKGSATPVELTSLSPSPPAAGLGYLMSPERIGDCTHQYTVND